MPRMLCTPATGSTTMATGLGWSFPREAAVASERDAARAEDHPPDAHNIGLSCQVGFGQSLKFYNLGVNWARCVYKIFHIFLELRIY